MAEPKQLWSDVSEHEESEVFRARKSLPRSPPRIEKQVSKESVPTTPAPASQTGAVARRGGETQESTEGMRRKVEEVDRASYEKYLEDFQRAMTDLNTVISQEKVTTGRKQQIHESIGTLQTFFQKLILENEYLRGQNDLLLKQNRTQAPVRSYASVASKPVTTISQIQKSVLKDKATRHTLFISGKDKNSKEIQKIMTENVKPGRDKINIRSMRSTEKVLIVETETEEDILKLNNNEALKRHQLVLEKPRKRNPLVIIYDLSSEKTVEEIAQMIYIQNFESNMSESEFNEQFKLRFKVGPRNRSVVHHVAEVSSTIRKILLGKGRVYMDFTSHSVKDYVVVARCLKCQDLGHIAKYCKRTNVTCSHCGEQDHVKNDCAKKDQLPTCIPCMLRKKKCVSRKDCPTYRLMMERLVSRTDYG